jgi:hypothetical protein
VTPRRLFALDQNFPEPIVDALKMAMDCADLVPVREINADMPKLEDWELLVRLRQHDREWDGLITCDADMLNESRTMAALHRTGLTLVIADGQGHNPVRATGLVLFHLDHVCKETVRNRPQVWILRAVQKPPESPTRYLEKIARHAKLTVDAVLERHAADLPDARAPVAAQDRPDPSLERSQSTESTPSPGLKRDPDA